MLEVAGDARVSASRGFLCARGAVGGGLLMLPFPLPLPPPCPFPFGLPLGACICGGTWCVRREEAFTGRAGGSTISYDFSSSSLIRLWVPRIYGSGWDLREGPNDLVRFCERAEGGESTIEVRIVVYFTHLEARSPACSLPVVSHVLLPLVYRFRYFSTSRTARHSLLVKV